MSNRNLAGKKDGSSGDAVDRSDAFSKALASTDNPRAILELFEKVDASNPKPEDLATFRQLLRERRELWEVAGDAAALAISRMVSAINAQRSVKESMQAGVEAIRDDLGYERAPMLEKLLIEQAAVCWLRMYLVDTAYTHNMKGSLTPAQGAYWERRLSTVQDRYLRAIETLARVRRLMRPVPVQVNIGAQQINRVEAASSE